MTCAAPRPGGSRPRSGTRWWRRESSPTCSSAKTDFLAAVSHELRTPLASIVGYLEILRDREAGPLTRVLVNLLSNAVKFTPRGGRVEVSAAPAAGGREEEVVVTVRDTLPLLGPA